MGCKSMAELLIKATDATNPDAIKDLRGCYKKSDVVVVKPDGWKWGKEELNKEKFYILRVPDKAVEELQFLTEPDEVDIGTRYIAEAPKLDVMAESHDSEKAAISACENMALTVTTILEKYGLDVPYNLYTWQKDIKHPIARRKVKLDIEQIEKDLQSGIVELTSNKVSFVDKAEGTKLSLSEIASK